MNASTALAALPSPDSDNRPDLRPGHHHVELYATEEALLATLLDFISRALVARESAVVIATSQHRTALVEGLRARCFDTEGGIATGRLTLLDAEATLARILVSGAPSPEAFEAVVRPVFESARAAGGGRRVVLFGEMVDLLYASGRLTEALRLEELWEELAETCHFELLCAYRLDGIRAQADEAALRRVYALHERVGHAQLAADDFRLLIESVRDYAIFMLDPQGHVASWNPGAERVKGYAAEEIIGEHFSRFYPPEEVLAGKCSFELAEALRTGRFEDEGWRVRKDGSRFWANVVITAVRDGGRHVGFAKVTRDLTERMRAQEQLRAEQVGRAQAEAAQSEAERRLRLGELLTGILAHDLRNPLTAILTAAQLVARLSPGERVEHLSQQVVRSTGRMRRMIDQLLDFTQVRLGNGLQLAPAPVDLGPLVQELAQELEPAPGGSIQLSRQGHLAGHWDADRLGQVVSNLLGNAVEHGTPGGAIRVSLDGRKKDEVVLETHNQGHIPEELLRVIFEPFRGNRVQRREGRGLGLGLFIAHEVVRLHGGSIDVSSTPEDGTRFRVRLPRSSGSP